MALPEVSAHRYVDIRRLVEDLVRETTQCLSLNPSCERRSGINLMKTFEIRNLELRGEMQERSIGVTIGQDVPELIMTDEQCLQSSLKNLIDNAIKFTDCGTLSIILDATDALDILDIRVVDTGCGIADEFKTQIFRPFSQQDPLMNRTKDGLGLSLFNAQAQIRKMLQGDVFLKRSDVEGPLKGSEFVIRLPLNFILEPRSKEKRFLIGSDLIRYRPSLHLSHSSRHPSNFLVVDDNAINRQIAATSLEKLGYNGENISFAVDGIDAVKQFESSLHRDIRSRYDIILMDIWMPLMNGLEASRRITEMATGIEQTTTVIIAVTTDVMAQSVERAKAVGIQGYLKKPYTILDMERVITRNFS